MRGEKVAILVLIGFSLFAALVVNLYVLPMHVLVALLYSIPVLITAARLSPLAVGTVGAFAIGLYLFTADAKDRPLQAQIIAVFALLVVGYLSIVLCRQRQETALRAEEAVRRARDEEAARMRLQELVRKASHDLAQPATIIQGRVQLLEQHLADQLPEPDQRSVLAIRDSARRMNEVIINLREAVRGKGSASTGR